MLERRGLSVAKFESVFEAVGIERLKLEVFNCLNKVPKNMWKKHRKAMKRKAAEELAFA